MSWDGGRTEPMTMYLVKARRGAPGTRRLRQLEHQHRKKRRAREAKAAKKVVS